jgi:hypothetical protein
MIIIVIAVTIIFMALIFYKNLFSITKPEKTDPVSLSINMHFIEYLQGL